MRFAYIDSQGNEVPIPSVDALALRIELGAIGPDTQLYDAQADRWGPASSHEIFHTLSRPAEEGFVAPPPPVVPQGSVPSPTPDADVDPGGEPNPDRPAFDLSDEFALEGADEESGGGAHEESGEADASLSKSGSVVDPGDDLGLDLTLTDVGIQQGTDAEAPEEPEEPEEPEKPAEEGEFDFGGFGELELEPTSFAEETPAVEPPVPTASDDAMDLSPPTLGGGFELEQPLSEFVAEPPPTSTRQAEQGEMGDDGALEFGSGKAEPPEEEERKAARGAPPATPPEQPPRERPTPRNRPSPPRRVQKRSPVGLIVGIVVVGTLAGGGWYGLRWYQNHAAAARAAAAAAAAVPPVTIPQIPAELVPKMRDLGTAALSATITRLADLQKAFKLPPEPPSDWLAGVYLANAGKYGDVHAYWQGIHDFVDSLRSVDAQVFHAEYVRQLEEARITGDTASMLLERADSGFAATREERWAAYALMNDLANASLDLHQFLLDNESQIDYAPAAGGVSSDPVLEAVPATKELGTEMWSKVDQITTALDSLGTLDKVTTERLVSVLLDRIQRAGFQ